MLGKLGPISFIAVLATTLFPENIQAQTLPEWVEGKVRTIYADPSDVVLRLDHLSPCGGDIYDIQRSAANFQELVSLMYTAAASGKSVTLHVVSCVGTRAKVSHGNAIFQ